MNERVPYNDYQSTFRVIGIRNKNCNGIAVSFKRSTNWEFFRYRTKNENLGPYISINLYFMQIYITWGEVCRRSKYD